METEVVQVSNALFTGVFFEKFIAITQYQTLISVALLLACFFVLKQYITNIILNF